MSGFLCQNCFFGSSSLLVLSMPENSWLCRESIAHWKGMLSDKKPPAQPQSTPQGSQKADKADRKPLISKIAPRPPVQLAAPQATASQQTEPQVSGGFLLVTFLWGLAGMTVGFIPSVICLACSVRIFTWASGGPSAPVWCDWSNVS